MTEQNILRAWDFKATFGSQGRLSAAGYRWHVGALTLQYLSLFAAFMVLLVIGVLLIGVLSLLGGIVVTLVSWLFGLTAIVTLLGISGWFILASVMLMIRRLHDFGYSGWWLLLLFPVLGIADTLFMDIVADILNMENLSGVVSGLFFLMFYLYPGEEEVNEFGDPILADAYTPTGLVRTFGWIAVIFAALSIILAPFATQHTEDFQQKIKQFELEYRQKAAEQAERI